MSVNIVVCLIFILQIPIISSLTQNNRIRSPIPPLNLAVSDIPMFLTITIDDALHQESYTNTGEVLNHFNPNDEQIPIVYFVSNDLTDYRKVQDRYLQGCEIAVHTVSHTTDINTDLTKWYHEIQTARDLLSVHADIPLEAIAGFRAPYLQKNDYSFQVLNGINPAFTYDSTIVATLDDNDLFDWPYTLDQYDADYPYQVGAGPADSYPGLWEIPMYHIYRNINITNKTTFHIMDYSANYTTLLNAFKSNFIHRLNTNKAPMGLYFHSPWFDSQINVDALNDFITWALDGNETWVVTNREVIDWMNNPVPISQGYEFLHSNQLKNGKTAFHKCSYASSFIYTVEVICPATFPHDLTWDANQLISTDITVSSTDNELTTLQETCSSDVYTLYDTNTAYCGTVGVYETVRYLDQLYSCQWWTQSEEPGVDSVWLLLKNCMVNTTSFVRADIVPYGTFNVFENNVLDINMHINDVYRLDAVSVIVYNSTYNLDIFDSYSLTYNSLVNVTLSIQFNTINVAEYEINFSFRNASTSEPTLAPSKSPTMNPSLFPSTSPTPFPTKNPSTAPSKYPSFSPSMPSYSPSMAPSDSTSAPSESTSAPSKVPSISPTLGPLQDSDDAAHIWEEKFSITVSHSTLIVVSVSILLLILLCVCAVYCVVKRYKKVIREEFEDNIVHRISVQSVLSQSVPSVFPGSGMAKPSKSSSRGSTIPPPALPAGSSMPPPPHTSIDIPPPPPETWDTYRSVEGV